jgi:hypothetical protein
MNVRDVILASPTIDEDLVLYAKRTNGKLLPSSEAVLLKLTDEEQDMQTVEVADRKCPGFSYCMEIFLIQEMMQDLDGLPEQMDSDRKVDRVIYYIEYDA